MGLEIWAKKEQIKLENVAHERSAVKNSLSTYVCYSPETVYSNCNSKKGSLLTTHLFRTIKPSFNNYFSFYSEMKKKIFHPFYQFHKKGLVFHVILFRFI